MTAARFEGTYTALVTPFREDQSIDWDNVRRAHRGANRRRSEGARPLRHDGGEPDAEPRGAPTQSWRGQ